MSKYHIGDTVQLREVTIADVWTGSAGTPFYTLEDGTYHTQDKLDILATATAPTHGIDDYFPMVKRRKAVSKYEGMSNVRLHDHLCSRVECGNCPCHGYDVGLCRDGLVDDHPELRHIIIAYLEAEDAAQENTHG